jgi:hypothetical protein
MDPRLRGDDACDEGWHPSVVIPAEAGIHGCGTRMVRADLGCAVAGATHSPEDDCARERVRGVLFAAW